MSEKSYKVYVIQGRGQRDYTDSQTALAQVPRRCGEEGARVLTNQRPLHVVNTEVYAAGHQRRSL